MGTIVERAEVWVASIEDKPGGLAGKLAALAKAGADLGFVVARRSPEKPGTGVVFVTPLRGDAEAAAGAKAGFSLASSLQSVRVEGDNKPGLGAKLTGTLAEAGINLRGLSAAVVGARFVAHLAMDTAEDADKAMALLKGALGKS
jgi:hypothetical protein